ncbi:hypothetical protein QBC35DRAFT_274889 [Podospora australis]|uniref:Uncharacterized protein n=1 Tax=Podospora australis TaxID=1536484 RepID=A0AAN6WQF0_9PEZI|nr:hypothetical protein QBC35DRAFT_274889 [Podospora australis]
MDLLPRSTRENWHRQLITSNARYFVNSVQQFPYAIVQEATDGFIRKRGLARGTLECDQRLRELIIEHARRPDGSERVAILACLHALSPSAASTVLITLREECVKVSTNQRFLSCLSLGRHANPTLIQEKDSQVAICLNRLLEGTDFIPMVKQLFQHLEEGPNTYIFPPSYVILLLKMIEFRPGLQAHLDVLQQQRKFMSLYNAISWLGPISALPDDAPAKIIVSALVPDHAFWTTWKPNYFRLMQWEGGRFSDHQRQRLAVVFDLEGPDTTGSGHASLKDSVPGCFDNIRAINNDTAYLSRLLVLLDSAQRFSGSHAIDFFIYLCVDNNNTHPLDDDLLNLAETVLETGSDRSIRAILFWLQNHSSAFNNKMTALTEALPVLEASPTLRELLSGYICLDVGQVMQAARAEYEVMLETDVAENLAMRIHAFGRAIVAASWLHDTVEPELLQSLRRLPPEETLHEIFDTLQTSPFLTEQVKDYLRVVIAGRDGSPEDLLAAISQSTRFYKPGVELERSNLAIAMEKLRDFDPQVHALCSQQLLVEDIFLVRDLLPIVRTMEKNSSCVEFTRLLSRRQQLRSRTHECWYKLLFCLISQRYDILTWSAAELPPAYWFQWVQALRSLFPDGHGGQSLSDLQFTPQRYQWWDLLSAQYGKALAKLEELNKGGGNLRWLWLQEVPGVLALLDVLQARQVPTALHAFVISYIQPSPYAISLVCASLSGLNRTGAPGLTAFESIITREQQIRTTKWHRLATQVLNYCWRQSPDINFSDRESLRALTLLMGFEDEMDAYGLYSARQCMMTDYQRLLSTARELQDTQITLQKHNAARTTAFFEDHGVEDAVPLADTDIPAKFSSFIEPVGDKQWEMCFPLKHLSGQKKQAVGIESTSRLLLVRISFLKQQPAFCMHFFPNNDSSTRTHGLWHVNGIMPDGIVCWTKPSLFIYLLSRSLYTFLAAQGNANGTSSRDLGAVYEMISTVLHHPTAICPVCSQPWKCVLHRPTLCSTDCTDVFQKAPLEVRAHHLLSDPPALDFLLTCIYSAAGNGNVSPEKSHLLPQPTERLRELIASFPILSANSTPAELLSRIRGPDLLAPEREKLLSWMAGYFRGCLVSAPLGSRIPVMPGVVQFLVRNSSPERETSFADYVKAINHPEPHGNVCFFGLPMSRMWEVMCEGLSVVDGSSLVEEPPAMTECGSVGSTWTRSAFGNRRIMMACETVGGGTPGVQPYHQQKQQLQRVLVRYVFLCPEDFVPPKMRVIGDALKQSFTAMRAGRLVKEI